MILPQGVYFAKTTSFAIRDISYTLFAERTNTGTANPLKSPEIPLGKIAQDLQRRNRVDNTDTADNFAFTLGANDSFDIKVKELGNQKGDANIRVVKDLNSNGVVDNNEIVAKGVSSLKGNVEAISGLQGAGDYILQVCQTKGNTNFEVKFDHAA